METTVEAYTRALAVADPVRVPVLSDCCTAICQLSSPRSAGRGRTERQP